MSRPLPPELRRAADELYEAFPDERERAPIDGCSHCLDADVARILGTTDRRAIADQVLTRYAFKAMTTWGDASDLRSLLPPILAGLADGSIPVDPQITWKRLRMAGVASWSGAQRHALERFLSAWMRAAVRGEVGDGGPLVVECAAIAGFAIQPLLEILEEADAVDAFSDIADQLLGSRWSFAHEDCEDARRTYDAWLASDAPRRVLRRALLSRPDAELADVWRSALDR